MPAELLERPIEVEDVSREPVVQRSVANPKAATPQPPKTIWRKIFEGHEEFLGWTPE